MGTFYEKILRPVLFRMDPEDAHERGMVALQAMSMVGPLCWVAQRWWAADFPGGVRAMGLHFPNPVGVAAGLDKNGVAVPALVALGFGFVEVGTVTPQAQPGNPRPRLFRYPGEEAIINRMGFNNEGALALAQRLARAWPAGRRKAPVGVNIGKAKVTPLDQAANDYLACLDVLSPVADYFVVNVSSPNTPGLRELQERNHLGELCRLLQQSNRERASRLKRAPWPLLLKISPDCSLGQVDEIVEILLENGFAGIIATNTTLERPGGLARAGEAGGLSGRPLEARATEIIRHVAGKAGGKLTVIGVGGIHSLEGARAKLDAGASLLQVYTGFIYRGPGFARDLVRGLAVRAGGKNA